MQATFRYDNKQHRYEGWIGEVQVRYGREDCMQGEDEPRWSNETKGRGGHEQEQEQEQGASGL
jgi:hypothetical protein